MCACELFKRLLIVQQLPQISLIIFWWYVNGGSLTRSSPCLVVSWLDASVLPFDLVSIPLLSHRDKGGAYNERYSRTHQEFTDLLLVPKLACLTAL